MYAYICIYMEIYICVCIYLYEYMYIYMCVCICIYVETDARKTLLIVSLSLSLARSLARSLHGAKGTEPFKQLKVRGQFLLNKNQQKWQTILSTRWFFLERKIAEMGWMEKTHLCVSAYKKTPIIQRKTTKGKKKGMIKVINWSEVKYEEKYKNNELISKLFSGRETHRHNSAYYGEITKTEER